MSLEDKTPQGIDPLENLYRNRFKEWETTPPDHLWAAIQPKTTSRRPLAWLAWQRLKPFVLASALLLSGLAGKYLYDKNTSQLAAGNAESASGIAQQQQVPQDLESGAGAQAPTQGTGSLPATNGSAQPTTAEGTSTSQSTESVGNSTVEPATSGTHTTPVTGATSTPSSTKTSPAPVVAGVVIASAHKPTVAEPATVKQQSQAVATESGGTAPVAETDVKSLEAEAAPMAKTGIAARSLQRAVKAKAAKARKAGAKSGANAQDGGNHTSQPLIAQTNQKPSAKTPTTEEAVKPETPAAELTTAVPSTEVTTKATEEKKEVLAPKAEEKAALKQEPYIAETRGKATSETNGWWLQAYAMPRYTFRNIQASSTSEMQVRRLSSSAGAATRLGYEAGARAAYKTQGNWEFNAGLHISQLSEELAYEYNRSTPDEVNVRALIDGSLLVTPDFQTHKATQKSRFFYAGLQTGASYYFLKERLRLSGGLGLNWLSQGNTARVENGVEVAAFSFPSAENPFEQLNMHTYLGLGFNLPVTERLGMVVEPTYTMFLFSTYSQREPLSVVPSTAGLNILLRYKL